MRWNVNITRTTREICNTLSSGFANSCFLNKMRNEYLRGNQTTWANTDARIRPLTSYEPDLHRRIAIRELWGEMSLMISLTA